MAATPGTGPVPTRARWWPRWSGRPHRSRSWRSAAGPAALRVRSGRSGTMRSRQAAHSHCPLIQPAIPDLLLDHVVVGQPAVDLVGADAPEPARRRRCRIGRREVGGIVAIVDMWMLLPAQGVRSRRGVADDPPLMVATNARSVQEADEPRDDLSRSHSHSGRLLSQALEGARQHQVVLSA